MVRYSRGKSDAVKASTSRELRATHQGSKPVVEHSQVFSQILDRGDLARDSQTAKQAHVESTDATGMQDELREN